MKISLITLLIFSIINAHAIDEKTDNKKTEQITASFNAKRRIYNISQNSQTIAEFILKTNFDIGTKEFLMDTAANTNSLNTKLPQVKFETQNDEITYRFAFNQKIKFKKNNASIWVNNFRFKEKSSDIKLIYDEVQRIFRSPKSSLYNILLPSASAISDGPIALLAASILYYVICTHYPNSKSKYCLFDANDEDKDNYLIKKLGVNKITCQNINNQNTFEFKKVLSSVSLAEFKIVSKNSKICLSNGLSMDRSIITKDSFTLSYDNHAKLAEVKINNCSLKVLNNDHFQSENQKDCKKLTEKFTDDKAETAIDSLDSQIEFKLLTEQCEKDMGESLNKKILTYHDDLERNDELICIKLATKKQEISDQRSIEEHSNSPRKNTK